MVLEKNFIKDKKVKSKDLKRYIDEINCLRNIPFVIKYSVFDGIENYQKI